jgi:UDP-N-acetylmuramate dehydrogenase
MRKDSLKKILGASVKGRVSFNESLKDHTTLGIGGVPSVWVEPESLDDLVKSLRIFSEIKLRPLVIGGGSNILARDGRIDAAVIKLSAPYFKKTEFKGSLAVCGSGCDLRVLIKKCLKKNLGGLEGLAGIPGTVGGAIMMNAGGRYGYIADRIKWVRVVDYKGRRIHTLKRERLKFSYRNSGLSEYIIIDAGLGLGRRTPARIRSDFAKVLEGKRSSQEYARPSAGCIFKNPEGSRLTSGQLIELCGLKGARMRGAEITTKHANFIINRKNARFRDVISLIKLAGRRVNKNYGIWLEPEIKIIE